MADELVVFQDRIRKVWHDEQWWFSVVDVIGVLTDSPSPRQYWSNLKRRLHDEGFTQLSSKWLQLKMLSADGKHYRTDAADTETILRIIQSIPSPKAEPFKRWLAKVGTERAKEDVQPSEGIERLIRQYRRQGYTEAWISQRLQNIVYHDGVTAEWADRGAGQSRQIAALTDVLSKGSFGVTTSQHKLFKGLKPSDNLRDSETILELAITGLAEATAATLHRNRDTQGYPALRGDCQEAGDVAKDARQRVEQATRKPVLSSTNFRQLQQERQAELQPPLFGTDTPESDDD
jgi:hypothetical protein